MQEMQPPNPNDPPLREYFTGRNAKELKARMDGRRQVLEGKGYTFVRRVKIGRNEPCPCGSGQKFKRCCISKINPTGEL